MVRIAGLEPARVAPLPPQSSVSANSTICAPGPIMKQAKRPGASSFQSAEKPLPAAPAVGLGRIEFLAVRLSQVPLHQHADAFRAASAGTDGVHAVGVVEHDFETVGRRAIQNAAAHAVEPVAGLRFAGQIIHEGAGHVRVEIPALAFVERHQVVRVEQHKLSRADFLVKIAGQRQREIPTPAAEIRRGDRR